MAINQSWFPKRLADQSTMFQNVLAKIEGCKNVLPITIEQINRIKLICNEFVAVYNYVVQARPEYPVTVS